MQSFEIPTSIWINFAVLVAAAAYVWLRLAASRGRLDKKNREGELIDRPPPGERRLL